MQGHGFRHRGDLRLIDAEGGEHREITANKDTLNQYLTLSKSLATTLGAPGELADFSPERVQGRLIAARRLSDLRRSGKVLLGYAHYWKACGEISRSMRYFKAVRDIDSKHHEAKRIEKAVMQTLANPETRTGDLGGSLVTTEFTKAVIDNL